MYPPSVMNTNVFANCVNIKKHANSATRKNNISFHEHRDLPDVFNDYLHDSQHCILAVVTASVGAWPNSGVDPDIIFNICVFLKKTTDTHTHTKTIDII